jgi:streptogramin lyase
MTHIRPQPPSRRLAARLPRRLAVGLALCGFLVNGFAAGASAAPFISPPRGLRAAPGAVIALPGGLHEKVGSIEVKNKEGKTVGGFKLLHWSISGLIVYIEPGTPAGEYQLTVSDSEGPSEPVPVDVSAPTDSGQTFSLLGKGLSAGPEESVSSLPLGVAEGPHGEVWFSNAAANAIGELTAKEGVKEYPLVTPASIPTGIAVDQAGNIWVADNGTGAVSELEVAHATPGTTNGESTFALAAGANPDQLSVDPYGNVWIAEGTGVLGEITAGSHQLNQWLIAEGGDLEGLVVDSFGNVWAVDEGAGIDEIVPSQLSAPNPATVATSGVYIDVGGGGGSEQLAAAPNGEIWFTEWGAAVLGVIIPSTTNPREDLFATAANYPEPPGGAPSGIGIDAAGNVFVEDAAAQAIFEFTPSGEPLSGVQGGTWKEFQVGSWITNYSEGDEGNNLAVLPSGNVVFSGYVTTQGPESTPTVGAGAEFVQGYLGTLPGVGSPASAIGKTISGGKTVEELITGTPGDEVKVPAGTEVLTSAGTPFEGTLPPPVADRSLIPGGTALFGDLIGGSAFSVSPELSDGVLSHLTFSKPVTVVFSFPLPAGVSAAEASEAKLYYYNFATLSWELAGSEAGDPGGSVSVSGSTVTITLITDHLSAFAAFHHPPTAAPPPPPPPTAPPKVKVAAHVNPRTGAIEAEYEFPEAGEAEAYGEVANRARIASLHGDRALSANRQSAGGNDALLARRRARGHGHHKRPHRAKRCRKGFVKVHKRCLSTAPLSYGRITQKVPAPGSYKLVVKATGKVLAALRHGKRVAVSFVLVFTPAGTADHIRQSAGLVLHIKPRGHRRHRGKHGHHKRTARRRARRRHAARRH